MRFAATLAASASLLSLASGRIVGISVPDTIKPGDGFNAYILVENYIQSVYDVAIAFGVSPRTGFPGTLGTILDSFYLGPDQSNKLKKIPKWITVPASSAKGPSTIAASLLSLYGASSGPTLKIFNVSVTLGDGTSTTYVSSVA